MTSLIKILKLGIYWLPQSLSTDEFLDFDMNSEANCEEPKINFFRTLCINVFEIECYFLKVKNACKT